VYVGVLSCAIHALKATCVCGAMYCRRICAWHILCRAMESHLTGLVGKAVAGKVCLLVNSAVRATPNDFGAARALVADLPQAIYDALRQPKLHDAVLHLHPVTVRQQFLADAHTFTISAAPVASAEQRSPARVSTNVHPVDSEKTLKRRFNAVKKTRALGRAKAAHVEKRGGYVHTVRVAPPGESIADLSRALQGLPPLDRSNSGGGRGAGGSGGGGSGGGGSGGGGGGPSSGDGDEGGGSSGFGIGVGGRSSRAVFSSELDDTARRSAILALAYCMRKLFGVHGSATPASRMVRVGRVFPSFSKYPPSEMLVTNNVTEHWHSFIKTVEFRWGWGCSVCRASAVGVTRCVRYDASAEM
jgi:hypothetical protein